MAVSVPFAAPTPVQSTTGSAGAGVGALAVVRTARFAAVRSSAKLLIGSTLAVLPLATRIVSNDGCPAGIVVGLKLFDTPIGEFTVTLRVKGGLASPRALPIAPPARSLANACDVPVIVGTVTSTVIVQVPARPIVPPVRTIEVAPVVAASDPFTAPVPVQLTDAPGAPATTMPPGSASVKLVSGIVLPALGLASAIVSVTGSPATAVDGVNVLLPVGGSSVATNSVALAGVPFQTGTPFSRAE